MKVRQTDIGRVVPDSVNQNKVSGFVQDTGLSSLGGAVSKVANDFQRAQVEIDQTYAEEARLNLDKDITSIFHDADTGYFNTSGKTAYEQQADVMKRVEAARDAHAKKLSPSQADMYKQVSDKMIASGQKSVMTHGSRGRKAWDVATQEAVVENSIEKATLNFQNDGEIDVQLATLRNSIETSASTQGVGPEATNERLQTGTSKFFLSVLGKAIEDDTGRAGDLFERVKKHLEPDDLSRVQKALKTSQVKESSFSTVDEWMTKGLSTTQAMSEAKKIKDPALREATENRFIKQQAIRRSEDTRMQNEAADSVYESYANGGEPDAKAVENMSGKAQASFKNVQRQDKERKRVENERAEKAAIKENYQDKALSAMYGSSWESLKGTLGGLPPEERAKIKAFAQSHKDYNKALKDEDQAGIKTAQDEYAEQIGLAIENGDIVFDDIQDTAIDGRLRSDQIKALKTRSSQIEKPRIDAEEEAQKVKSSNIEWQTRIALLDMAKNDPQKAMTDFRSVAERFDPVRRIAFEKQLKGLINKPNEIDTVLTATKRIDAMFRDSKGKVNKTKAFEVWEKWDVYQQGIQAENNGRKPNAAETNLFFKEATKEVITDKGLIWDSKGPAYKTESFNLDVLKKLKDSDVSNSYKAPVWKELSKGVSEEVGIPNGILESIVTVGEKSNHNQTNSHGTYSPFQITSGLNRLIKKKYGFDAKASPYNAAKAGALIIKERLDAGAGIEEAIASYHGGINKSNRGPVNKAYVERVMADLKQKGII